MDNDIEVLKHLYDCFNARDIDGVLGALTDDVAWANKTHGLRDKAVAHVFSFREGKVTRFDIQDAS